MKVLLVDDEYLALNLMEEYIKQLEDFIIVDKVKQPLKAIEVLQNQEIDILFLDIQMPLLSGTNLLKVIKNPPLTIFTTAYTEFAVEAFELNAVDYLVKPFSFERFLQSIQKAKKLLETHKKESVLETEKKDYISVKVDGKIRKIYFDDILFVEGLKEYVKIICGSGVYVTLERMKNMEEALPQNQFIRVHKSYIVSKKSALVLNGNMLEIEKHQIPISREKRDDIIKVLFE
ncbi:chemotaxis protein CheY [bacterium 336/3]|nr:chemotaxis protein CheY [bacterium 336/3]